MFPGMGGRGMNPRKLNQMMRQLGIEVEDIDDVVEVIVRTPDKEIVFTDAAVSKMVAQGNTTWQLTGTPHERPLTGTPGDALPAAAAAPPAPAYTDEDVKLVMDNAEVDEAAARKALDDTDGQPAEAIIKLMGE